MSFQEIAATDLSESVAQHFEDEFDHPPQGVWRAPGRVNLVGEHVDYQEGLCLPIALPHSTFAAVARRSDDQVRLSSRQQQGQGWTGTLQLIKPGEPSGWAGYLAGVLWALGQDGVEVPGVDVVVDSAVPVGAGLSSSAALECALALAVADLVGLRDDDAGRDRLAAACVRAENEIALASTGGLDQTASLRAQRGHALLLDCRNGSVEQVPLDLDAAGLVLLVVDTRAPHRLVDSEYSARRRDCSRAADMLGTTTLREVEDLDAALQQLSSQAPELVSRVRHVVGEIQRVRAVADLLRAGSPTEIGGLLDASHESLRHDYEVSSPELDLVVETARRAGALGARMTGGGFGGSAIALVPASEVAQVEQSVRTAFSERDWQATAFVRADASGAAERVR